jgi:protein-tyrosine phosphatase
MAEALFQRRLDQRGLPAVVTSAGLLDGGAPATRPAVEVMAEVGLDISRHRSRQVTRDQVERADLVVTMARQHLIELTLMMPDAWPRMFQVRDLLRRAETVGPRPPGQPMGAWLAAVGDGRTRSGLLTANLSDDVDDPIGQPVAAYERTRQELDELFSGLARLL